VHRVRRYAEDTRPRKLTEYLFKPEELGPYRDILEGDEPGSGWLRLPKGRHVLLAACGSDQKAKEVPRGRLPWGLFRDAAGHASVRPGRLSYRDLIQRTASLVRTRVGDQNPQLDPTDDRDRTSPSLRCAGRLAPLLHPVLRRPGRRLVHRRGKDSRHCPARRRGKDGACRLSLQLSAGADEAIEQRPGPGRGARRPARAERGAAGGG
jgi:hypothetical protein